MKIDKLYDMKKTVIKRSLTKLLHPQLAQKPYGFCCEEKEQDPGKRYDMRNPPFESSLTDVVLHGGGPGAKFRVEEIGPPPYSIQRRILEVKGVIYLGRCKRSRGPLRWYVEDEIAVARELLAEKKRKDHRANVKRRLKIARRKAREHRSYIKETKFQKNKNIPDTEVA